MKKGKRPGTPNFSDDGYSELLLEVHAACIADGHSFRKEIAWIVRAWLRLRAAANRTQWIDPTQASEVDAEAGPGLAIYRSVSSRLDRSAT